MHLIHIIMQDTSIHIIMLNDNIHIMHVDINVWHINMHFIYFTSESSLACNV